MEGKQVSYVITSFYSVYPAEWGVRDSLARRMGMLWEEMRSPVVVPMLKVMVMVCLAMSVMLFVERVYMAVVMLLMKMTGFKPQNKWKWEPLPQKDRRGHHHNDLELGTSSSFPMVLVQIPMRNEKEVYQLSITAACKLSWPADRLIVQVLDDSTDPLIKELVEGECKKWAMKGVNVKYVTRENRKGHKAGNLREGMKHSYVKLCDYVAIFDADFEPEPDFLKRTVPFLVHNPEIALVQARWTYVNADECMLTRMQEMSLDYHFAVEQEVGSSTYSFFGFNGTAGVWRISALNDAGGWKDRSTVEDMDLAVRASLRGWKFVYAGDVKVKSELPSTFKAYRNQQRRWSCGPAYLFRQTIVEILRNTKVCAWKKFYVIYSFFFVRKIIAHVVTFVFYCLLLPATVLIPEVQIPRWGAVYLPSIVTLLNAVGTPRSLHLLVFSILFENVTAMDRAKATLSGLLELGRVNEWIVTEKLGATLKNKSAKKVATKFRTRVGERFHLSEFLVGAYLFVAAWYDLWHGSNHYFVFLFLQSFTFIMLSFNYVGIIVPNS